MRRFFGYLALALCLIPSLSLGGMQREPWPGSTPQGRLARKMDPLQVQAIVDNLNEESKKRHGQAFILKHYFDLGPLNRVQVAPELWKGLTSAERRRLGNNFAKAFRGTGLLFCQFLAGDAPVGKVVSDPIRGGLKFVSVD